MHNVLHTEPEAVLVAMARLIAAHDDARADFTSGIATLVIIAVADGGENGSVVLSGCDSDECRAAAISFAAKAIAEIPRTSVN